MHARSEHDGTMNDVDHDRRQPKPQPSPRGTTPATDPARAHRRGDQRLRRRRAALRPVARRRSPRAAATAYGRSRSFPPRSGRRRAASPARSGNRIRIGARSVTNGGDQTDLVGGLQRAGAARPRARGRTQARLHHPAGEHVAGATATRRSPHPTPRSYARLVADGYACTRSRWSANAASSSSEPRRGKNMFALGMLCNIYSFDLALGREQIALAFGKKDRRSSMPMWSCCEAGYDWAGAQPRLQVPHPGRTRHRAADRHQRQHRPRARRPRVGHGNLRDVPDHAGHLGVALPVRCVREGGRRGAPGRGRDRRLRLRHRRLLCGQMRGHHHLRPRLLAEAGRHRAGGDGRDSAGGGERPARRAEHRPADQGRAGRPADRDVRQPWRRAEGGDRAQQDRGMFLLR